jgi:hypothetical protein
LSIVPVATCAQQSWECLEGRRDLVEPQVLVCVGHSCLAPAHSLDEVRARLDQVQR